MDEEKFNLFCRLFGLDRTQVSTWCLMGDLNYARAVTFRLYQLQEESNLLGVTLPHSRSGLNLGNRPRIASYSFVRINSANVVEALQSLVDDSEKQLVQKGISKDDIQKREAFKTIGINNPEEGYTLLEAIKPIFKQ